MSSNSEALITFQEPTLLPVLLHVPGAAAAAHPYWLTGPTHQPPCNDENCFNCAAHKCPARERLHNHHDGCPCCDMQKKQWTKAPAHNPPCAGEKCFGCAAARCTKADTLHNHRFGCPSCGPPLTMDPCDDPRGRCDRCPLGEHDISNHMY